jgi:hypothetical protein
MRNSPQKVGVSFLHDFPVSTLALTTGTAFRLVANITAMPMVDDEDKAERSEEKKADDEDQPEPEAKVTI